MPRNYCPKHKKEKSPRFNSFGNRNKFPFGLIFILLFLTLSFFVFNLLRPTQPAPAQAQTESAIAIRVFKNPEHLSPEQWYKENVPHPANPQSTVIDGYQAVRDGRSLYVSAANLGDDNRLYSNIYLISYSEGASTTTQKIFEGVLANWQFNSNILPNTAGKVCSNDYATVCSQDKDCPTGETCLSIEPKPRLTRDVKRLADLQDIRQELEDYNYQAGSFPTLSSGTYIPKLSFSVWPSWEKTLGQNLSSTLPTDPINRLMGCTNPYDPTTCWDNKSLNFSCPLNYYIYAYQSPTLAGDQAKLYTKLEYLDQNWASTLDILTNPQELLANCQLNFGQNTNDYDNDTIPNGNDNCPTIPNTTQTDSDGDKIGDACDACPNDAQNDQDNDGYCVGLASLVFGDKKSNDNCPTVYNPSQQENPAIPGTGLACSRCIDADADSYCSYATGGDDCDDTNTAIHPGAPEIPNGLDDNCDGKIDECLQVGLTQPCYTGPIGTEGVGICKGGVAACKATGLLGKCIGEITPQTEKCDATLVDSDCDGNPNNGCDLDGDGECTPNSGCYVAYGGLGNGCPNGCCDLDDNDAGVSAGGSCQLLNQCPSTNVSGYIWNANFGWLNLAPTAGGVSVNNGSGVFNGYAWSVNLGWVNFQGVHLDLATGEVSGTALGSCPDTNFPACPVQFGKTGPIYMKGATFGVNISKITGNFSGYAWARDVGWLRFDGFSGSPRLDPAIFSFTGSGCLTTNTQCQCVTAFQDQPEWSQGIGVNIKPSVDWLEINPIYTPYVWVASSGTNSVYRINADNNAVAGPFAVGVDPSRTAVALDGSVWVANRDASNLVNPDDTITHLRSDGTLIQNCTITGNSKPRGLSIDAVGNVWLASYNNGNVFKLDPNNCNILHTYNIGTWGGYGAAVDGLGNVWVVGPSGPNIPADDAKRDLTKINIATDQVTRYSFGVYFYGIAIDKNNNIWVTCWDCQSIYKIGQNGSIASGFPKNLGMNSRAIAVDKDNNIWVTHSINNKVTKLDNNGNVLFTIICTDPDPIVVPDCSVGDAAQPIGITATTDSSGQSYVWAVNYTTARASKFDLNGNFIAAVNVGSTPYTYSDMAGYMLRAITLRSANWTIKLDSHVTAPVWRSVSWNETEPTHPQGNSYARIRIRSAASEAALDADPGGIAIPWSNYFDAPPIDILLALPTFNHQRWLQIQADLHLSFDDQSPIVDNLKVELSY